MDKENVASKRLRTNNNGAVAVGTTTKATIINAPQKQRLKQVYLVFTCDYPLQNNKWGEHSGHETQDTRLVGVYANLKEANKNAKYEVDIDDAEDDESDDDEESSGEDEELYSWEEEDPCDWTARRVWVEKQKIQY